MDESLFKAAKRGEEAALTQLIQQYQRPIYALCYRMLGNSAEAEDAAQEVFIKMMTKIHTYDPSRPFAPWLFRVATNHCRDRLRQRKPVFSLEEGGEDGAWEWMPGRAVNPEEAVESAEEAETVRHLLGVLSPLDKALVTLFYWQGLSYAEMAEATGLTVSAVKSRLFRARREMARHLRHPKQREVAYAAAQS